MTPEQFLQRVKEEAEKAHTEISDAVKRQWNGERNVLNLRIPADPSHDTDLIVTGSLRNVPWLVRGWELQRAVIRALNELALATGLGSDTRISKAQLAADVAEQALAAFEKEMENWT